MAQYQQRVSTDRFGRPFVLCGLKDKKGTGYPKGSVNLKGQDYLIEVTDANKEGVEKWVKITKLEPQKKQTM